jgi:SAM-dependent methyltransferase
VSDVSGEKADYGNWVSSRLILAPGGLGVVFAGLSFLLPPLGAVAGVLFLTALYFAYAQNAFSPDGGDLQRRVQELVLDRISEDGMGKVLDVGCGNGPLTIETAKRLPEAEVMGIDYWGGGWAYSKEVCERNAAVEGVAERVAFQRASAASLPFRDGTFDGVVSNLVFHEVRSVKDKRMLIKEALRVVRKGGWFAFQDLFLWKAVYGEVDDLLETVERWGIQRVDFVDTSVSDFIPRALRLPFMLGTVGILYGKK